MKQSGPDSLKSWVIAAACCFINMMMYGMARLSGVLFVASVPRFNVSREKASFPYTFSNFVRNTSGPFVGFLGHRFGVRAVTTFGCMLGAIGAGACYFAESIDTVTVLWGAIFGLGFGLGNILLPVSINQYFDKHRATASGISFSGACLGSFILPSIVEILINTYGLSGTYLFLSGFILNCIPAALLLRKPNFEVNQKSAIITSTDSEKQSIVSGVKVKLYTADNKKSFSMSKSDSFVSTSTNYDSVNVPNPDLTHKELMKRLSTQTLLSGYAIRMSTSESLDVDQILANSKRREKMNTIVSETESSNLETQENNSDVFEKEERSVSLPYEKPIRVNGYLGNRSLSTGLIASDATRTLSKCLQGHENAGFCGDESSIEQAGTTNRISNIYQTSLKQNINQQDNSSSDVHLNYGYQKGDTLETPVQQYNYCCINLPKSSKSSFSTASDFKLPVDLSQRKDSITNDKKSTLDSFNVFFDPVFLLIAITNALYTFTFVCMITIIVDYARDVQIGISNEKYILMTLSVGDIIGRLGLGWVTDRGFMTTIGFTVTCFLCQGVVIAAVVWCTDFVSLMTMATLYGLSEAGLICIFPVIIAQYIDPDKQTIAIPSSNFLSGPLCLAVAPLIGYFRDDIGSYDFIFYGLAILSGICCLSWLLAPCIFKCRENCQR